MNSKQEEICMTEFEKSFGSITNNSGIKSIYDRAWKDCIRSNNGFFKKLRNTLKNVPEIGSIVDVDFWVHGDEEHKEYKTERVVLVGIDYENGIGKCVPPYVMTGAELDRIRAV